MRWFDGEGEEVNHHNRNVEAKYAWVINMHPLRTAGFVPVKPGCTWPGLSTTGEPYISRVMISERMLELLIVPRRCISQRQPSQVRPIHSYLRSSQ